MDFEDWLRGDKFPSDDPSTWESTVVNGAMRADDGTFMQLPGRRFRADGRERLEWDELVALCELAGRFLRAVPSADVIVGLVALKSLRELVDRIEHELVAIARGRCWAWVDVAAVLGVHASTVQRRFAREEVPPRKRRSPRQSY